MPINAPKFAVNSTDETSPTRRTRTSDVNSPNSVRMALQNCGVLTASTVALGVVFAGPAYWIAGAHGLEGIGYAALLCWLPGFVLFVGVAGFVPNKAVLFLIGSGLRMMTVLLAALVIHQTRSDLGLREFFGWLVLFYSVTLLVETLLIVKSPDAVPVSSTVSSPQQVVSR